MIFFTADQHFSHEKIIQYCNRPFQNLEEMHQVLIERWNSKIQANDEVYILGDFAFGNPIEFISSLNGKKHLIAGSHDAFPKNVVEEHFESVSKYKEIRFEKRIFILSHCPIRCWEHSQDGSIHLFGHEHGRIDTYNLSMDVGVDTHDFFPYSMPEILVAMDHRKVEMREAGRIFMREKNVFIKMM